MKQSIKSYQLQFGQFLLICIVHGRRSSLDEFLWKEIKMQHRNTQEILVEIEMQRRNTQVSTTEI